MNGKAAVISSTWARTSPTLQLHINFSTFWSNEWVGQKVWKEAKSDFKYCLQSWWRHFCRIVSRKPGKRLGRCCIQMHYGTVLGMPSFLLKNGSKRGPIKQFEATPTQSLATSGRFARKSIRPDLSHFALWHTTLCWRLAYLSEIMFKLRLDSKYVITAYLSLFLF